MFGFVRKVFADFSEDGCGVRAAALAYYTIFALPPLLILLILMQDDGTAEVSARSVPYQSGGSRSG
jgi:membrane protein